VVLRDGTIRDGDTFFYFIGSYSCSGSKWNGEVTSQEHTSALATKPFARKVANIGFTGTYSDMGAENRQHGAAWQAERQFQDPSVR
jgi:hypothetical protein